MIKRITSTLVVIFHFLSAMEKPNETAWVDTLPEIQKKLILQDNVYKETPTENASLDYDLVMTPFWKKMKQEGDQKEKNKELGLILQAATHLFPRRLKRYYTAAAIFAGAQATDTDYLKILEEACWSDDLQLVQFLIDHQLDFQKKKMSYEGLFFYIHKESIARYLVDKGVSVSKNSDTMSRSILHHTMKKECSRKLIPLYLEQGASWNCHTDCDENILHFLARHAHTYDCTFKIHKKFNMVANYLNAHQLYTLLSERDKSEKLPEFYFIDHSEPSIYLSQLMRQRREWLEQELTVK